MTGTTTVVTGGSGFIGTNLVTILRASGTNVVNYDRRAPVDPSTAPVWRQIDLADFDGLRRALDRDRPSRIVHLAAETRIDGCDDDFICNVLTTRNLLDVAAQLQIPRTVIASTMLVHPLGTQPRDEKPGTPDTAYGRSKAAMELMVRGHKYMDWTIIRPTTIWGPWHLRLADEFISRLARGYYVHPDTPCLRSYGYVENVCHQILALSESHSAIGRCYFVGDQPIQLSDYVDAFSIALRSRPARRVPSCALAIVAQAGDILRAVGIPFPLSTYRLRNMTQNNIVDVSATIAIAGSGPYSLDNGVARTIAWWRQHLR